MSGPLEPAPASTVALAPTTTQSAKPAAPAGAYRPPGARGTLTPNVYKREDEGGAAYSGSNGAVLFPHSQSANGAGTGGFGQRGAKKGIPGAPPGAGQAEDPLANRRKKKGGKKGGAQQQQQDGANGDSSSAPGSGAATPAPAPEPAAAPVPALAPPIPVVEPTLSPEDKKRRAIVKKLTAIEQLKVKKAQGEKLELTQHKKLDSEAELRKELAALGA